MIFRPQLVALDSSHWEQWINDSYSSNASRRATAAVFYQSLMELGFTVLFSMHHLVELMAHGDDALVAQRLRFVQARPFLSWIGIAGSEDRGLGAITDIMAAEVGAALEGRSLEKVREAAKRILLRSGEGREPIPEHPDFLPFIKSWAREHVQSARTITALAPMRFLPQDARVHDLMAGSMREESELRRMLMIQSAALVSEIETRGDERIHDAPVRAWRFLQDMLQTRAQLPDTARDLILAGYALRGIDANEIGADATVGEMDALGEFRSKLRVIAEKLNVQFETIKRRVQPHQLPHWIVADGLKRFGQDRPRRPGSDLDDGYHLSLAVYADVAFVDKRTYQDFQQTKPKVATLATLTGRVEKAARYCDIPKILGRGGS